ncbi:MAG: hypothetical protein AAFR81_14510 [Chloroflexota bacterium]
MNIDNFIILSSNDLVRHGIQSLLKTHFPERTIQSEQNVYAAIHQLPVDTINVVFLDDDETEQLHYKKIADHLKTFRQQYPASKLIFLSQSLSLPYVQSILAAGADGFIYKQDALANLLPIAIQTVLCGQLFLSPSVSALPFTASIPDTLNKTDLFVLELMANGLNVQEIAVRASIVDRSVYRIRTKLRTYLGVRTNEQIVIAAQQQGIIA